MIETFLGFLLVLTVLTASATLARKSQLAPAIVFLLVGIALAGFMALALPLGLETGFIRFHLRLEPMRLLLTPIGFLASIPVSRRANFWRSGLQ